MNLPVAQAVQSQAPEEVEDIWEGKHRGCWGENSPETPDNASAVPPTSLWAIQG